jgi:chromosome segregation ATPase
MRAPRLRAERVQHRTPPAEHTIVSTSNAPAAPAGDDPQQLRAGVERLRTWISDTAAQADTLMAEAHAAADRLVADAQTQARALTADHHRGRALIRDLEERAGYLEHAQAVRAQAEAAEQLVDELTTQTRALAAQRAVLTDRLVELAAQREDTATALTTAREAGDVAGVAAARTQMSALEDVAATLNGRCDSLTSSMDTIGEPDGRGELATAQARAAAARAELRRVENLLDPDRLEAQVDRVTEALAAQLADLGAA